MSLTLGELRRYRSVESNRAMTLLLDKPMVFLGDTFHTNQPTQGALVELFGRIASHRLHPVTCLELNKIELGMMQRLVTKSFHHMQQHVPAVVSFENYLGVDLKGCFRQMQEHVPDLSPGNFVTILSGMFTCYSARRLNVRMLPVDYDDKNDVIETSKRRLARDREVAQTIRRRVYARPCLVKYGTAHLQRYGLRSFFPDDQQACVFVFGGWRELLHCTLYTYAHAFQGYSFTAPHQRRLPELLYLGRERQFLKLS